MSTDERVEVELEGRTLSISNLDKVLYPRSGFTKGDLIAYYVGVAPVLLGHLADRPLTVKRFPDGVDRPSFFEKNVPVHAPDWVHRLSVPRLGRTGAGDRPLSATIDYIVVSDLASLVWVVNLASIELHVPMWRASGDLTEDPSPDTLVLDLDPGLPATIVECCDVALTLRDRLAEIGLHGLPKTSGRKGLQLYAPLDPPSRWIEVHDLALELARRVEAESGGKVVSNMRRDRREGRVLIDWSQNHPAKTTVAPYSLRAGEQPTASTPVSWDEVAACAAARRPEELSFTPTEVLGRVERLGDLFAPIAARPSS